MGFCCLLLSPNYFLPFFGHRLPILSETILFCCVVIDGKWRCKSGLLYFVTTFVIVSKCNFTLYSGSVKIIF